MITKKINSHTYILCEPSESESSLCKNCDNEYKDGVDRVCKITWGMKKSWPERKTVRRVPRRTLSEKLSVIEANCMGCEEVTLHPTKEMSMETVGCKRGCSCNSHKPLVNLLAANMFKCPRGHRLDDKLEDMMKSIAEMDDETP
jgi:hypothetical protein